MEAMAPSSCFWRGSESFHFVKFVEKDSADGWLIDKVDASTDGCILNVSGGAAAGVISVA